MFRAVKDAVAKKFWREMAAGDRCAKIFCHSQEASTGRAKIFWWPNSRPPRSAFCIKSDSMGNFGERRIFSICVNQRL